MKQLKEKYKSFTEKYHRFHGPAFFTFGFLFDLVFVGRVDDVHTIIQQGVYLVLIAFILIDDMKTTLGKPSVFEKWPRVLKVKRPAAQFMFGTLLNCYAIFYFHSASVVTSFEFLIILAVLLYMNESQKVHQGGQALRFGLLALCVTSYFAYLVPTLIGEVGTFIFILSLGISTFAMFLLYLVAKRNQENPAQIRRQTFLPGLVIQFIFLLLYFFRMIPPVPISVQFLGVYHHVEKNKSDQFELSFERSKWRFWENGDQTFLAQPGDPIIVFFRLFSPAKFSDEVFIQFYMKNPKGHWDQQDRIPIKVVGGREHGFRGYANKTHYSEGHWMALLKTSDDLEIGRIHFSVTMTPKTEREFNVELQ